MSNRMVITGGHLIPGDGPERHNVDVLVEDGAIAAIDTDLSTVDAEVIDATGMVVLPGFVDGHRHVWQAPLRGIGADLTLPRYFEVVLGRALSAYRPEDARLATLLGAAEALDAGITTVFDWSNTTVTPAHTDAVVDGFTAAGIRAVIGHTNPVDETGVRRLAGLNGLVTGGLAILGPQYGPWEDAIREIRLGRELGMQIAMHAHGGPESPIRRLHEDGLLGPDLQFVHLNAMTGDEAARLADTGTGVTVTPIVEATMGHGASAYGRFRDAGGRAGLGTDVVVNAPADLFEPMRDALRYERLRTGEMYPAAAVLAASTVDSARAIGLDRSVGTLTVGKRADIILLDGLSHLTGTEPIGGAVVTSLGPANVHTVLVDGRVVKRNGRLVHDLAAVRDAGHALGRRALGQFP